MPEVLLSVASLSQRTIYLLIKRWKCTIVASSSRKCSGSNDTGPVADLPTDWSSCTRILYKHRSGRNYDAGVTFAWETLEGKRSEIQARSWPLYSDGPPECHWGLELAAASPCRVLQVLPVPSWQLLHPLRLTWWAACLPQLPWIAPCGCQRTCRILRQARRVHDLAQTLAGPYLAHVAHPRWGPWAPDMQKYKFHVTGVPLRSV